MLRSQATKQAAANFSMQVYHASCSLSNEEIELCGSCRQKAGLHYLYAVRGLQPPLFWHFGTDFIAFLAFADEKLVCSIFKDTNNL